jgi:hypothetical protein
VGDPTLLDRIAYLAQRYPSDAFFLWSVWSVWAINQIADADENRGEDDWQFQTAMDTCGSILRKTAESIS